MRKYIQKQLLEVLNTTQKTNEILYTAIQNRDKNNILTILTQMQESAIYVGTEIEKSEGENNKVIRFLEQYCEQVYHCSQESDIQKQIHILSLMSELIEKSRKELQTFQVKLEIVFMPYKASMWDCLESVWMEADADNNCACYVMPIPYFDKKEDGTFGQMHYEGNQFPEYVPITDYKEYDLKQRHPDIIYIHNPFDQYNKATSVHPDYYCALLKGYTEMLVYIPYFITGQHLDDSHKLLPAYIYADRIILQNDTHIEDIDEVIPREKLVALGSPKVDKILRLCENPPEMPIEWNDLVNCEDGTKNKVVMFNISITGLLKLKDQLLKKMEYVFHVVKKVEGVVLLWRPHPLIDATLKSLEPELLEEYNRLKNYFIREKIGIYDDTPDPATSIAFCDAYIGENSSSLVHMFGVAGKPIFILDNNIVDETEIVTEEEMRTLSFIDMAIEGNEAWFVSNRYQAICKMSMETGEAHVVARIPDTHIGLINLYSYIYKRGNKLYLTPLHTEALCIYDIETNIFQKIYFPNSKYNNFMDMSFRADDIILKPCGYDGIVRYNEKNGNWTCIDGFLEEYESYCEDYDDALPRFIGRWKEYDNKLYMPCLQCNYVMVFNILDNTWKFYEVGKKGNTYKDIVRTGREFWLLPYKSNTWVKWNIGSNTYKEFDNYKEVCTLGAVQNENFGWWHMMDEKLFVIPLCADAIIQVDIETDTVFPITLDEITISERKFKNWLGYYNFDFVIQYKDKMLLKWTYDESILLIESKNNTLSIDKKLEVRLSKEDSLEINKNRLNAEQHIRNGYFGHSENKMFSSLRVFMEVLSFSESKKSKGQLEYYLTMINNMDGSAGKTIYQYIMNESK